MENYLPLLQRAVPIICSWYAQNKRPLPWRQSNDPYHAWIAEIMLQQTRIEAVIPYYHRFLTALPTVQDLATVEDDKLMKLWEGLGYYSRARNLKKAAQKIANEYGGALPQDSKTLKTLPGIGDYTAGAIASIAFHQPSPAVDGNVLRVLARACAFTNDIMQPQTRKAVTEQLQAVYPTGENAAYLTEGLMELGELICIPNGAPLCEKCPLQNLCQAHANGNECDYPVKSALKPRKILQKTVLILQLGGIYALIKRPEGGLLSGLWEFPNYDGLLTPEQIKAQLAALGITAQSITPCGAAKHIFTHLEWHMTGFIVACDRAVTPFTWASKKEIATRYALPTAFAYFTKKLKD